MVLPNGTKTVGKVAVDLLESSVELSVQDKNILKSNVRSSRYRTFMIDEGFKIYLNEKPAAHYFYRCISNGVTPHLFVQISMSRRAAVSA